MWQRICACFTLVMSFGLVLALILEYFNQLKWSHWNGLRFFSTRTYYPINIIEIMCVMRPVNVLGSVHLVFQITFNSNRCRCIHINWNIFFLLLLLLQPYCTAETAKRKWMIRLRQINIKKNVNPISKYHLRTLLFLHDILKFY